MTAIDSVVMESFMYDETPATEGIGDTIRKAWDAAVDTIKSLYKKIKDLLKSIFNKMRNAATKRELDHKFKTSMKSHGRAQVLISRYDSRAAMQLDKLEVFFIQRVLKDNGKKPTLQSDSVIAVGDLQLCNELTYEKFQKTYSETMQMMNQDPSIVKEKMKELKDIISTQRQIASICTYGNSLSYIFKEEL